MPIIESENRGSKEVFSGWWFGKNKGYGPNPVVNNNTKISLTLVGNGLIWKKGIQFREGNGRAARLLADLMAMQANYYPLDYTGISKGKQRKAYFRAVQEGMNRNYRPMIEIFDRVISRTLKEAQQ